jgi:hypothetical protein
MTTRIAHMLPTRISWTLPGGVLVLALIVAALASSIPVHVAKADTFCISGNRHWYSYTDSNGVYHAQEDAWDDCLYYFTSNVDKTSYSPGQTIQVTGSVTSDVCDNEAYWGTVNYTAKFSSLTQTLFNGTPTPMTEGTWVHYPVYGSANFTAPSGAGSYGMQFNASGTWQDTDNSIKTSNNSITVPFTVAGTNRVPVGHVDSLSCTNFTGWSYDPDASNTAIPVVMTVDGGTTQTVLTPTSGGSITDAGGTVWTLHADQCIYQNGFPNNGGCGTGQLTYVASTQKIWGQDFSTGNWYWWDGATWQGPTQTSPISSGNSYTYNPSVVRSDVNSTYGISGTHGYSTAMPAGLTDGNAHVIKIFAQDTSSGTNTDITNGGTTLTCSSSAPSAYVNGSGCTLSGGSCSLFISWKGVNTTLGKVDVQQVAPNSTKTSFGGLSASTTQSFTVNQAGTYVFNVYNYNTSYQSSGLLGSLDVVVSAAPTFTCNSASSCTISQGSSASLQWACASGDSSSGGNFATGGSPSGSASVNPSSSTTYTLQCQPSGSYANVNVTVQTPSLSLTINPPRVHIGQVATVQWSATNVTSCSVNGPNFNKSGLSGSATTTITGSGTFTLNCSTNSGSISITRQALLVPVESEQ